MDDYVAYDSNFKPLVASCTYNGGTQWQPFTRDDLLLIDDAREVPGGWLYLKIMSNLSVNVPYKRVFAVLRGDFMFFFDDPNEDPSTVVPIANSEIVLPDRNNKTFDDRRVFKVNDGFEFDIKFKGNPLFRLYAFSEDDRMDWVNAFRERKRSTITDDAAILSILLGINEDSAKDKTITSVRLMGSSKRRQRPVNNTNTNNNKNKANSNRSANPQNNTIQGDFDESQEVLDTMIAPNYDHNMDDQHMDQSVHSELTNHDFDSPPKNENGNYNNGFVNEIEELDDFQQLEIEARSRENAARELASHQDTIRLAREKEQENPMTLSTIFRMLLLFTDEELVQDPPSHTQSSHQNAVGRSGGNNNNNNMPNVKGQMSEHMLTTVYQYYCGDNGYMALEQFIEFMDDSGILQTHAPRDDNDEPLLQFQQLLDPVTLMTQVPRDLGYTHNGNMFTNQGDGEDRLCLNFAQFYSTLVTISEIVYREIAEKDLTLAVNKLLQESICPLFAWCTLNRIKRGSVDVLVLEDRIPLLVNTYAPNLWRVFLMYATDSVNKPADLTLSFPEFALANEKGMFGTFPGVPWNTNKSNNNNNNNTNTNNTINNNKSMIMESLYVSESGALRFCVDYALSPYILNKSQIIELLRQCNRHKRRITSKLSTRDQAPTNATLLKLSAMQHKLNKPINATSYMKPTSPVRMAVTQRANSIQSGGGGASQGGPGGDQGSVTPSTVMGLSRGLGFSEFVELICRIAIVGFEADCYHSLFPTPFSKVLAMLTVFGVADLSKLEDVRILHNLDVIPMT